MSDKQEIEKAVDELKNQTKEADNRISKAVAKVDAFRQEQAEKQSRPD